MWYFTCFVNKILIIKNGVCNQKVVSIQVFVYTQGVGTLNA